jgi:hypothetical protein
MISGHGLTLGQLLGHLASQFVVNRGGEYCFMPGLRALPRLAELDA